MLILGIDSSSVSAAVGVMRDGKMLASGFCNNGLTHSQTLLPLIEETIQKADIKISDIELMCITRGPGSFTGLRIGLASLKGLAAPNDTDSVSVSTLEAIAYSAIKDFDGIICPVMDARCNQVYNALFEKSGNTIKRLCEDRAILIEDLDNELKAINKPIILCGDGTTLCSEKLNTACEISDENNRYINGEALCVLADKYKELKESSSNITPVYLRLPQAVRELKLKKN